MKTPVLIAAYNEAQYIDFTLKQLDASQVEPFVLVNGEPDGTVEIAERYTANVFYLPEQGKLPALQHGLRTLGKRALEPLLLLDADAAPTFPKKWPSNMVKAVAGSEPAAASGSTSFWGPDMLDRTVRSLRRMSMICDAKMRNTLTATYGANIAINIANEDMLDHMLAMPHIWPGEDRYIAHTLGRAGTFTQLAHPYSNVRMSIRYVTPLRDRLRYGRQAASDSTREDYRARRAPTVTHFWRDGEIYAYDQAVSETKA